MRRTLFAVAMILVCGWEAALAQVPSVPQIDPHYTRAINYFYQYHRFGDGWKEAQLVPPDSLMTSLNNLPLLLQFARMAEIMGEFDLVHKVHAKAEKWNDNAALWGRKAYFAARLGRTEEALRLSERVIAAHGKGADPELFQLQIDLHLESGDFAAARKAATRYDVVVPNRNYCEEAKQHKSPVGQDPYWKSLRLAVLAQPERDECLWAYGYWLTDAGFVRMARSVIREASRIAPKPGDNYLRIRLSNGRDIPKLAEQLYIIGRERYLRDNDSEGAVRLLTKALHVAPEFARPYAELGRIALDQGDLSTAISWFKQGIQVDPDSWGCSRFLAKAYERTGKDHEALMQWQRVLELFPSDIGAHLAVARHAYRQQNRVEYTKHARAAVNLARAAGHELRGTAAFLESVTKGESRNLDPPSPDPPFMEGFKYE